MAGSPQKFAQFDTENPTAKVAAQDELRPELKDSRTRNL